MLRASKTILVATVISVPVWFGWHRVMIELESARQAACEAKLTRLIRKVTDYQKRFGHLPFALPELEKNGLPHSELICPSSPHPELATTYGYVKRQVNSSDEPTEPESGVSNVLMYCASHHDQTYALDRRIITVATTGKIERLSANWLSSVNRGRTMQKAKHPLAQ